MRDFMNDVRYGLRILAKSPGFAAVAMLALALGIGANTAIFSVADTLLFRPLLLNDLDRLVVVRGAGRGSAETFDEISPADFLDFREQNQTLEHLSLYDWWSANITGTGEPERVQGFRVTASFFEVLGTKAAVGRTFLAGEDEAGRERVVVLNHGLWQRRFGADPKVLGQSIELNGQGHQVIGVMSADVRFPPNAELFVPLVLTPQERTARADFSYETVARLKQGVSLKQAAAEFETLARRLSEKHPQTHAKRTVRVAFLRDYVSGDLARDYIVMLLAVVGFVLLIACANVANLQFARVSSRSRELAVRAAMGAGRWRVVRQLLTESVLLALFGGALGVLLAMWGVDVIRSSMPAEVEVFAPRWRSMGINPLVLAYTLGIAALGGILAGVAPALVGSRTDLNEALKEGGHRSTLGVGRHRLRDLLVVSEIVLALVLLVGAGLMVKGFRNISVLAPNLEPERILTMQSALPESKYPRRHHVAAFQEQVLRRLSAIPEASAAGLVSYIPYGGSSSNGSFIIERQPEPPPGGAPKALLQSVSPGYLRAMRIPLLEGREFTESDGEESLRVAIISQSLGRRYFSGENPVGKRLKLGLPSSTAPWMTVVGVCGDIRHNEGDRGPRPTLYRAYKQAPPRSFALAIRTSTDPKKLVISARAEILAVDRDQPVFDIKTMEKVIRDHLTGLRYVAALMGVFGLLALALATVGVYSVMAYSVTERTHEIGVRMALGAKEQDVLWLMVRRGMILILVGLGIGVPSTFVLARVLSSLIFGVVAHDLSAFTGVFAVLLMAALLACYFPARRAARTDPMVALKYE